MNYLKKYYLLNTNGVKHFKSNDCEHYVHVLYFDSAGPRIVESPYINDPLLISTISFSSRIRGITIVERELFVICRESNVVHVYDANTTAFQTKFLVGGLIDPLSLASTSNALFISEVLSNKIYQVGLPAKSVFTTWKVDALYNTLSTTNQGNLLVSCVSGKALNDAGESYELFEYTPDGILQRRLILSEEMRGLKHAVQIGNDRFVLTHVNVQTQRVCLVDGEGKLLKSYGGASGSGPGQLDNPRDVVVDRRGFVFVTCLYGNKVVLLNSELEFVKDIIPTSANIRFIDTICLDEYRGVLYVSDNARRTMSVFKLNGLEE